MFKNYVVGFIFSEDKNDILLVKKKRPDWQKGYLNGIGGHIELWDDSPLHAMIRECKEETGLSFIKWKECSGIMKGKDFIVYIFKAYDNKVYNFKQIEDEYLILYNVNDQLNSPFLLDNLYFLIPYLRNSGGCNFLTLNYD